MRLLLTVVLAMLLGNTAQAADDFGARSSSQHVYDRAGILSPQDTSSLEQKASELLRAGAPTVVYVRVKEATLAQARQEARDLMDAWNVESSANARDGLVMLVDLKPDDTQHGQLGLFAGQSLTQLTSDELDRIATDAMGPALRQGELGPALGIGLDAARADVQSGAPAQVRAGSPAGPPGWLGTRGLFAVIAAIIGLPFLIMVGVFGFLIFGLATGRLRFGRGRSGSGSSSSSSLSSFGSSDSGSSSSGGSSGGTSF
jgi:uncharacterized membrane protein YgcG